MPFGTVSNNVPVAPVNPPANAPANPPAAVGLLQQFQVAPAPAQAIAQAQAEEIPLVPVKWEPKVKEAGNYSNISPTSLLVLNKAGIQMYPWGGAKETVVEYMREAVGTISPRTQELKDACDEAFTDKEDAYLRSVCTWRKAKFFHEAQDAICSRNFDQVLLIADGWNPMVIALATMYPWVQFYCTDLDKGAMEAKQAFADKHHLKNIHAFTLDVTQSGSLAPRLKQFGFDRDKKTYCQAEGLVYYIPPIVENALVNNLMILNPENVVLIDTHKEEAILADTELGALHRGFRTKVQDTLSLPMNYRAHSADYFDSKYPHLQVTEVPVPLNEPNDIFFNRSQIYSKDFTIGLHEIARENNYA